MYEDLALHCPPTRPSVPDGFNAHRMMLRPTLLTLAATLVLVATRTAAAQT